MNTIYLVLGASMATMLFGAPTIHAAAAPNCMPTGFYRDGINMTAARINPAGVVSGEVDATGCNIGVYYDTGRGAVDNADIHGAKLLGILINGDVNAVSADVQNSTIHDIGETPFDGTQHGIAVYYRNFGPGATSGKVWNNDFTRYQKGGIVANGTRTSVDVRGNTVTGQGPIAFIAQNGIQIGYGAFARVMGNTVTGNSYTGDTAVSGGIIMVGGPAYGTCVGSLPCAYTTGTIVDGNTVVNNDVGIWLSNYDENFMPPAGQTNIKVVNNIVSNDGLHNNYAGFGYQVGIADLGNNDKIIHNSISGAGYDPNGNPTAYTVYIDADASFTNRPKVHANY